MTPHKTGSTTTPGDSLATAPPTRTFGLQGPTLGALIDAYLQDYQVRQFRSVSTARGRVAHLTAFFGRAARAAALTTYQIRQYQLARRAAGAATGTINRETSALHRMCTLAVHWGWLDTVPGFPDRLRENPPRQGFFEHPEYLAVRAHLPAPWQDILDLAYYSGWRKQEILGLTWDEIDEAGGVIRLSPARSKTLVGRILPISHPIAEALARRRARHDPTRPLVFHRLHQNACKLLFINCLLVYCTPLFPHCTPHSELDFPAPRTPAVDRSGLNLCRPPPHADLTLA